MPDPPTVPIEFEDMAHRETRLHQGVTALIGAVVSCVGPSASSVNTAEAATISNRMTRICYSLHLPNMSAFMAHGSIVPSKRGRLGSLSVSTLLLPEMRTCLHFRANRAGRARRSGYSIPPAFIFVPICTEWVKIT